MRYSRQNQHSPTSPATYSAYSGDAFNRQWVKPVLVGSDVPVYTTAGIIRSPFSNNRRALRHIRLSPSRLRRLDCYGLERGKSSKRNDECSLGHTKTRPGLLLGLWGRRCVRVATDKETYKTPAQSMHVVLFTQPYLLRLLIT